MSFKTTAMDAKEAFATVWKGYLHYETKAQLALVILKMVGLVVGGVLLGLLMIMCLDAAFTRRKLDTCCNEDSSKNKKVKKIESEIKEVDEAIQKLDMVKLDRAGGFTEWLCDMLRRRLAVRKHKLELKLESAVRDRDEDIVTYAGAIPIYEMSRMLSALPDKVQNSDDIDIINADPAVQKTLKLWNYIRVKLAGNERFKAACANAVEGFPNFYTLNDDAGIEVRLKSEGADPNDPESYDLSFNSRENFCNFASNVEDYRKAFVENVRNAERDKRLAKLGENATPEAKARVKKLARWCAENKIVPLGLRMYSGVRNGAYSVQRKLSSLVDKINSCSESRGPLKLSVLSSPSDPLDDLSFSKFSDSEDVASQKKTVKKQ